MSPLRWDVLTVGLVLALPVLALYLRGDFTVDEVAARLPWCLLAGWGAVALLRWAATPRTRPADRRARATSALPDEDPAPVP
ncbi:hypothetical protein JD79_00444 [Geodermatophilus normandii]|uniref:Uncharacterized protein n=1 Tax=Geodermatophilus normandii TaxID=1137989 RepID=A0A317QFD6_9ACTN|nr:hypothetical protein [Geodermatophilus normandii]PWW21316.1 hypothetical protein JD79_00444 [Geodermatophilus normandii]